MIKHKVKAKKPDIKFVKIKTGTVESFFSTVKDIMQSADESKTVESHCATLTFADPAEMLHFLSATKIKLINNNSRSSDKAKNIRK
jgi:hypothetical protein